MDGHEQLGPFTLQELMERGVDTYDIVFSPVLDTWAQAMLLPELYGYFESKEIYIPIHKNYAGFGWRLLAFIIDTFIWYLLSSMVVGLYEAATPYVGAGTGDLTYYEAIIGLIFFVGAYLYQALFECLPTRGSIGKIICRLVVVKPDGKRLTFLNALGRNLMKILSAMVCYLGFLSALWDSQSRTWHDMAANAYVIRRPK
jgi:uncharacterized RDD family membrane protein YckC